jgi:hypothetical protein
VTGSDAGATRAGRRRSGRAGALGPTQGRMVGPTTKRPQKDPSEGRVDPFRDHAGTALP